MGQCASVPSRSAVSAALLQAVTAIATAVGAVFAWLARSHARTAAAKSVEIEDAVNHRHRYSEENGDNPPRLYDLALENRARVSLLETMIRDHVTWEETVKWRALAPPDDDE